MNASRVRINLVPCVALALPPFLLSKPLLLAPLREARGLRVIVRGGMRGSMWVEKGL